MVLRICTYKVSTVQFSFTLENLDYLFLWLFLLHQNDQNTTEEVHKINKQIQGMPYKVLITVLILVDNQLSIKQYKTTENQQSEPQLNLLMRARRKREKEWEGRGKGRESEKEEGDRVRRKREREWDHYCQYHIWNSKCLMQCYLKYENGSKEKVQESHPK